MPRKQECNPRTRVWERARRERLNDCFTKLGTLLPDYDPAVVMSKVDILQKAATYIRHLNQENQDLLKGGLDESSLNQLKLLHARVEELVKRTQQLSSLLRDAGISIPASACGAMIVKQNNRWSNKIRAEEAEALVKKVKKKRVEDRKQREALRKLKADRTQPVKTKALTVNDKKKPLNSVLNTSNIPVPSQPAQPRKKKTKKKPESKSKTAKPLVPVINNIPEQPQRFIFFNNSTINSPITNPAPCFVKPLILNQNIVKPNILTAPIMATRIQTCRPSIMESNPSLARLGPGTLILANGNIVPVLPPVLVNTTKNQTLFMMNNTTSTLTTVVTSLANSPKSQRSLVPKPRRRDTTTTTFSNKVPIPALVSVDRSVTVGAMPLQKSLVPSASVKTAKKSVKKKLVANKPSVESKIASEELKKSESLSQNISETQSTSKSDNSTQMEVSNLDSSPVSNQIEDVTKISVPIQQISNLLNNVENVVMEDKQENSSQSKVITDQTVCAKRTTNDSEITVESKRTKLDDPSNVTTDVSVTNEVISELSISPKDTETSKGVTASTNITKTSNSGSYTIDALCRLKTSSGEIVSEESVNKDPYQIAEKEPLKSKETLEERVLENVTVKQIEVPVTKEPDVMKLPVRNNPVCDTTLSTPEKTAAAITETAPKSIPTYLQSKLLVPTSFSNESVFYKSTGDFMSTSNANSFLPINDNETTNVHTSLSLAIQNNDLSNDIFASLQVPQHPESISPTAAFLLAFPLVSTLKATEMMDAQDEANSDSLHGTPTLLQIGNIESEPSRSTKRVEDKSRQSIFEFENYSGMIPPIISKPMSDFSPEKFLTLPRTDVCSDVSKHNHNLFQSPSKENPFLSAANPLADSVKPCHPFHIPRTHQDESTNAYKPPKYCDATAKSTIYSQTNSYNYNLFPGDNSNNYSQTVADTSSILPWTTLASTTSQFDSFDGRNALPGIHEIYGKSSEKATFAQGFKYRRESKASQSCKAQSNSHRPPVNWMTAPDSRQPTFTPLPNQTQTNAISSSAAPSVPNPIFSSVSNRNVPANLIFSTVSNHSISTNTIFSSAPNHGVANPIFSSESNHSNQNHGLSASSSHAIFQNPIFSSAPNHPMPTPIFTSPSHHSVNPNPMFTSATNTIPTNPVSNNHVPNSILSSTSNHKTPANTIFSSGSHHTISTNPIFSSAPNHQIPNPVLSSASNQTIPANNIFSVSNHTVASPIFSSAPHHTTQTNPIFSSTVNTSIPKPVFTSASTQPTNQVLSSSSSSNHLTSNHTIPSNPIFTSASTHSIPNPIFTSASNYPISNSIFSCSPNHSIPPNPIFTAASTQPIPNPIFTSTSNHPMSNHILSSSSNHPIPSNPIFTNTSAQPIPNPIFTSATNYPMSNHIFSSSSNHTIPPNPILMSASNNPTPSNPIFPNPIFSSSSNHSVPSNPIFSSAPNRIASTSHQTVPTNPILTSSNQTSTNNPIFPTPNQSLPSNQIFPANQSSAIFSGISSNPILPSSNQTIGNSMFPPSIGHSVPFASASDPPALANSITTTATMMDPQRQFEQNLMFPGNNAPNLDTRTFNAVPFYGANNIYAPNCQVDESAQVESGCYSLGWNPSPKKSTANGSVYVPSTLPTLIGDLALGTNFAAVDDHNKQFVQGYDEKNKSVEKDAAKRAKTNEYQNPSGHFLSVSQLVDHSKSRGQNSRRSAPGKPRQDSGYREVTPNWKTRGNYKAPPVSNYSAEALIGNQSKQRDAMKVVTLPAPMVSERFSHQPTYNQRIPPPFAPDLLPTGNYFPGDSANQNQNYGNAQNAQFTSNYNSPGFLPDNYSSSILPEAPNFIFPPATIRNRAARPSNVSYPNQCLMKTEANRNTFNARRMAMVPTQCGPANTKQKPRRRIPDPIVSTSTTSGMGLPEYLPMDDAGGYQLPTSQHKTSGIYPMQHHRVGNATSSPNATNSLGTLTNFNLSTIFPEINDKHAPSPIFNTSKNAPPPGGILPPPGQMGAALPPPDFAAPPLSQVCRMQWS